MLFCFLFFSASVIKSVKQHLNQLHIINFHLSELKSVQNKAYVIK